MRDEQAERIIRGAMDEDGRAALVEEIDECRRVGAYAAAEGLEALLAEADARSQEASAFNGLSKRTAPPR